jgi:hypothetical protein
MKLFIVYIVILFSQGFALICYDCERNPRSLQAIEPKAHPSVKILYTAALIPHTLYEGRKQEYVASLRTLNEYGYKPYVVESCLLKGPSFFENYTPFVLYWDENNPSLKNKGVNELKALIDACLFYQFNTTDMIIKLTGRYHLDTRKFLNIVEENLHMDAIYTARHSNGQGVFTGCFAMKAPLFLEMLLQMDPEKMETDMIDFEIGVEQFIKTLPKHQIQYVEEIDLTANIAGGGNSGMPITLFY